MSFVVNDSYMESHSAVVAQHEDWIIQQAIVLLERRIFKASPYLNRPAAVRDYLRLKLVVEPNEIFAAVFLDSMHQVLAYEPLFKGTINSASIHPRVVVQRVLELNAAAVVFAHQHPSGVSEPSSADRMLTQQLQAALALIDVRVLDHIIVGQGATLSFARPDCCSGLTASLIDAEASVAAFSSRRHKRVCGVAAMRIVCWGCTGLRV